LQKLYNFVYFSQNLEITLKKKNYNYYLKYHFVIFGISRLISLFENNDDDDEISPLRKMMIGQNNLSTV
jgi:hypothetical protein